MTTPEAPGRERLLRALIRTQAISGLLMALFLTLHLGNAVLALAGPAAYDGALALLRRLYQTPVAEVLLFAVIAVHAGAGWWRYAAFHRDKPAKAVPTKAHRIIGRVLSVVVILHILGTRLPEWVGGLEVDMSFSTFALENYGLFFYPYYLALFTAGAYHLIRGVQVAAGALKLDLPRPWLRLSPTGARRLTLGLLATGLLVVLAFGGWFHDIDHARYEAYRAYNAAFFE